MKENNTVKNIARELAEIGLNMGAVKINTEKPFLWASGYKMPIYNDNRLFLKDPKARSLIADGFIEIIKRENLKFDSISGTATAGIPHATTLADRLELPLTYVRSGSKKHGMGNKIEGLEKTKDFNNSTVLLIEDLISTGKSAIDAAKSIYELNGNIPICLSIFTYGLEKADKDFSELGFSCKYLSILTFDEMMNTAVELGKIDKASIQSLKRWQSSPLSWAKSNELE